MTVFVCACRGVFWSLMLASGPLPLRRGDSASSVEPIERLGPVSSTHCCAFTPGLSTWWSSTALGETWFRGGFPA